MRGTTQSALVSTSDRCARSYMQPVSLAECGSRPACVFGIYSSAVRTTHAATAHTCNGMHAHTHPAVPTCISSRLGGSKGGSSPAAASAADAAATCAVSAAAASVVACSSSWHTSARPSSADQCSARRPQSSLQAYTGWVSTPARICVRCHDADTVRLKQAMRQAGTVHDVSYAHHLPSTIPLSTQHHTTCWSFAHAVHGSAPLDRVRAGLQQQLCQLQRCILAPWQRAGACGHVQGRAAVTVYRHAGLRLHQQLRTLHMACRSTAAHNQLAYENHSMMSECE